MTELCLSARAKVQALEDEIARHPQVDCPVRHYFAPGLYAREMTIPAGVYATGVVHRTEHLATLSAGRLLVEDGTGAKEIAAPYTFVSPCGAKRAVFTLETTVLTTYHPTTTTDLDALCEELTESTTAELLGGIRNKQLLNAQKGSIK